MSRTRFLPPTIAVPILGLTLLTLFFQPATQAYSATARPGNPSFQTIYQNARAYTVLIATADISKPTQEGVAVSIGTGYVFLNNNNIRIATANHVVEKSNTAYARFADDPVGYREVRRIGYDDFFDLAILEFKDKSFRPQTLATLGDANTLMVQNRETFYVMGNPLSLESMWTEGKLMGGKTNVRGPSGMINFLPLDITCNPGNSGGPLINEAGKVVGIVDAIAGIRPICLAIPINILKTLLPRLENGAVEHGMLGIGLVNSIDLLPAAKNKLAPNAKQNVIIIKSVMPDSPADKAGVKTGDILVSLILRDGKVASINKTDEFIEQLNLNYFLGDEVGIIMMRSGGRFTQKMTLTKPPK